ncbi:MAG: C13 family peptidase [Zoogloeaceae bacterium]|jgi:hypothetical protein|nr:C13 family peptidase [Zoogloeaceae bacterium]
MTYTLEYEISAGLMGSAQRLAARLLYKKIGWWQRPWRWAVFLLLCVALVGYMTSMPAALMFVLLVYLVFTALLSNQHMLLKKSVAHYRRCTLTLDDAGLCVRTAISESRYSWREARDLLPQRGWLAIVLTPIPMVMPIPDNAFADAAARQAFMDALREGMQIGEQKTEDGDQKTEDGGQKTEDRGQKTEEVARGADVEGGADASVSSSFFADLRQVGRMLCFRAPPAGTLTPDAYKFLLCLLLFGLFTLSAQIAQYGPFGSVNVDTGYWSLRLLLLTFAYVALLACGARILGGAAVDALRLLYALCLLLLCLPWAYAWSESAGLAELWRVLGLSTESGIFPYVLGLPLIWLLIACVFQFPHREARPLYRGFALLVFAFAGMSAILAHYRPPELWYAARDREALYVEVNERVLYGQSRLLTESLAQVRAGVKGRPELFFIGLGGEDQEVFLRETQFVERVMNELFATEGHSLILVNHASTAQTYPMANAESLRQAVKRMGEQMNGAEDVLFLFLTSHGSRDFRLSLAFWPFSFTDISPQTLRQTLDDAGIERRVLVISACYSGGFIPALQDENTLVITAAAADRSSYGCGDENALTEFGRAYFAEALPQTRSIEAAFEQAANRIAAEEAASGREASLPQIAGGNAALRAQLQSLRTATAPDGAKPHPK